MLRKFIDRPVLASVISIIIVVLGIIGLASLPVEQYPNIAPPTVRVSASYSGASADVMLNSVVIPLEESINGVEGMTYMTSTSETGSASIIVYFKQGINPDMAAVNVQNKVSQASALLPAEVTQAGVTVRKQQSGNILMLALTSKDPQKYEEKFLQNYANINITPQLSRVYGVGDAAAYGSKEYSMRIWLKPDAMVIYNVSTSEVTAALSDQNIEAAPGTLGENGNQAFQYTLKYTGRLSSIEEYKNIIIRSKDGNILRLGDIADVELGSRQYNTISRTDGNPSVMLAISQTAGSNASQVIEDVKALLKEAEKNLPPDLEIIYLSDASRFLDASIEKVIHTLLEAFVLVFLVVFIFLQNFRTTLIPAIAVPVAIVGTFFFLWVFGFSINLLTLFALVLAIGIVVDDAIVVVEAVHSELEKGNIKPRDAAVKAMNEIAPAIVSITLVMASVFIPVSFIGGTSGVFYKQFGLTLAVAIVLSAINALTLSPALCALFLKKHDTEQEHRDFMHRFYYYFNLGFGVITKKYSQSLGFLTKKSNRWIGLASIALFSVLLFWLMHILPTGFVPQEDSGAVMGTIILPPGTSMERTDSVVKQAVDIAMSIPGVTHVGSNTGRSFTSGSSSSYGSLSIRLADWKARDLTASEIATLLTKKTSSINNASFLFFGMPTITGFGMSSGVSISLQDRTGGDINKFFESVTSLLSQLNARPEVMNAKTDFNPRFPQNLIEVNMAKVKESGLTLNDIMKTLQVYIGSYYASNFNLYGKLYRVMIQASPEYRTKLEDLSGIYVKTANGTMAPITEYITITKVTGPQTRTRFNLYTSIDATIIPNSNDGYSTGDVIKAIDEISATTLPEGFSYEFSGLSREEANSSNNTFLVFALCLIFVYLLLAALYESYILPWAVILSLPIGLSGVYLFLSFFGLHQGISNNIYVQISLIMLIGLLAKNAILIVEYAIQRHQQGMGLVKSAIEGAVARLRPILMTSFALIFGLMPLALSTGAGAIGNRSIGISAIGGMLIGTLFGVLIIPALYVIFQDLQNRFSKITGK